MPTYNGIVDDILDTLGYGHDDALRNRNAVLYNVILVANKLKAQQLSKNIKTGDHRSSTDMLSTYIVPITHNNVADDVVTDFDASYFDLPRSVYDVGNGGGINFVRYLRNDIPPNCTPALARTPFTQTTLASLNTIYDSAYQKPQSDRPYFCRAHIPNGSNTSDRVYLFGVPQSITHLHIGLFAAADFMEVDPDESIDLPDHLLHTAKKMLLEMESWLLQIPQERLKNDGRDLQQNQTVQTRPIISVNDPSQFDV